MRNEKELISTDVNNWWMTIKDNMCMVCSRTASDDSLCAPWQKAAWTG